MTSSIENVPKSGVQVELKSLDVQVTPECLKFGLGSHQAPVGTLMKQELILKNTQSQDVTVLIAPVDNPDSSYKFCVNVSCPNPFVMNPGKQETVTVKMKILCTTTLKMELSIKTWKDEGTEFKEAIIPFCTESALSSRLDPHELKIEERIGEGSFDVVHKGDYRGIPVAIKARKNNDFTSAIMKEDFISEVKMMESLRHPAIVVFVGAVHVTDKLMVVTELCQYGDLFSAMKSYPEAFNEKLRLKCLVDVSSAMKFLHQSGCVHRDLKPNKILVVSLDPQTGICAKVSGFETARNWNRVQSKMMLTMTGTPLFMAPEIMSCKPYDKSVDVYSFGLVMYYVVTGKVAFMDDESTDSMITFSQAVLSGKRPEIPSSCNPRISELIKKCWSGEPSERPSFEVVHETLKNEFENMSTETKKRPDGEERK